MADEEVLDGSLVRIDPLDQRVFVFNWDRHNLNPGVSISSNAFTIKALKPRGLSVVSITRSGTTATVTTTSAHGLTTGDWVTIAGATPTGYNLTAQVTVLTGTTFTYTVSGALSTPATGTITFAAGLGKDNESILSAAPYNSRYTRLRLIAGGVPMLGRRFEVGNTIVTDESPAQTKDRKFEILIENL